MPRQKLGQHFLADASWRARILRELGVREGEVWLEIGAGHGEMTAELARQGARVWAVELDSKLLPRLEAMARAIPAIIVVADDILKLDLARLAGASRIKVYGSLPYYITSPILHRLFEQADQIDAIFVVIQLEVAARLAARPGRREYGYLSVLAQFYSRPEILLRIPPGAFRPRPKVTSALVALHPPGEREQLQLQDAEGFLEFVKSCFGQKRKTLFNNLKGRLGSERAQALLASAGVHRGARAEQLSVTQLAGLFRAL